MSSSNYPPGMSASQIPGFDYVDVNVNLKCEVPAMYVEAQGVHDALASQLQVVRDALGDEAWAAIRQQMETAARNALYGHWARADEIDPHTECGYEGDVDGTRHGGVIRASCPRCDWEHEINDDQGDMTT